MITRNRAKDSGYTCSRCKKPIMEGRAEYTMREFGETLCGSRNAPSYCVEFRMEELAKPH